MSKAVISNRIYFNADKELMEKVARELTYKIEIKQSSSFKSKFDTIEIIKNYKIPTSGVISIPQGRKDLIPEGYTILDKRVLVPIEFPEPNHTLFPEQLVVYDKIEDTTFINALPGWGKTFTALHLARKLGQKTLVVTHTTTLRDQWVEEIESLYGIKPSIIGSGKYNLDGPIVVGNIQTLSKHILALSKVFGTVILDEAHHTPASTFASFIDGMHARYRIALSGTLERKDGKHILFKDYFGPKVITPPQNNTIDPKIKLVRTGILMKPGVPWTTKINELLYDEEYQKYVALLAAYYIGKGYKVLIVADRVEFLTQVQGYLGDRVALVTGTIGDRNAAKEGINSGRLDGIVGSRQIFAEGISINALSCLILAAPINNNTLLEQLVGRIMRKHDGKLSPLVVDLQFLGAEKRQNTNRLAFYASKGWEIDAE